MTIITLLTVVGKWTSSGQYDEFKADFSEGKRDNFPTMG